MSDSYSPPEEQPVLAQPELLTRMTVLCNELDELMMLHEFYYQAVENLFDSDDNNGMPVQRGLSLFPTWLRQRDVEALATVHQLQEALRNKPE